MNLLNQLLEMHGASAKQRQLDDVVLSVDWSRSDTVGGAEVKAVAIRTANKGDGVSEAYLHISYDQEQLKCEVYYNPFLNVLNGFDEKKSQEFDLYVGGFDESDEQSEEYQNLRKVIAVFMGRYFEPIATHYLEEHKENVANNTGMNDDF